LVPVRGINAIKGMMKTARAEEARSKVEQELGVLQTRVVLPARVMSRRADNTE
jgi:hypothetical protein